MNWKFSKYQISYDLMQRYVTFGWRFPLQRRGDENKGSIKNILCNIWSKILFCFLTLKCTVRSIFDNDVPLVILAHSHMIFIKLWLLWTSRRCGARTSTLCVGCVHYSLQYPSEEKSFAPPPLHRAVVHFVAIFVDVWCITNDKRRKPTIDFVE